MYKKRERSHSYRQFYDTSLSKKGQVTVFIIIGMLLLLSVAIIFLFQKEILTFEKRELVPVERGPIESFVTNCLDIVTTEALYLMGQQGGFIQLPESVANDANLHLKTSPFTVVPHWAYGEIQDTPTLKNLKERIDRHIEQNLAICVLGTQAFEDTYDLIERSPVSADTKIVSKKILFNVDWDVQVRDKRGEVVTELKKFITESPIKLQAIHELAVKIIERELREMKLEDITQDLLALEAPNVPLFGTEFSCTEKRWKISDVKQGIKDLLRINIRELKVKGTEFVEFPKELTYYQNHYVWDLEEEIINPDTSARFTFEDNYPFAFDVSPRSGQFLRSNQLGNKNDLISFLCMQSWKFVYNLDFPVLVEVTDETTGYTMKFGTTVHLKNNIPDRSGTALVRRSTFFDTYSDDEYCGDADVPMTVKTYELIENKEGGVYFRSDLGGVDLEYTCLKYSCDISKTQYDYGGFGFAGVITNFPYCSGAILRGKKEGYTENFVRVVSRDNQEIELELLPLKEIATNNIKVVKHKLRGDGTLGRAEDLDGSDIALVTLKFRQNSSSPPVHDVTFIKSLSLDEKLTAEDKISLLAKADFNYDLEISLLEAETIKGGYKGKWFVSWDSLQNAEEITFHVLSQDGLSDTEQFELFASLEDKSLLLPLPEVS
jgi:hypothetical protein